ncbi:MAG: rod-binding protein [Alphaproteobacteria bacterium]|nr:rod-binding protein [Alphaproteobacteria bacterium]
MSMLGNITDTAQVNYALQQQANAKMKADKPFNVEEAKKAAEDFEAFFITTTLESMFAGVKTDGLMGGGSAEKIYRSMMFNEYGKLMAKNGGVGVSDQIMSSILAMQEMNSQGYITAK